MTPELFKVPVGTSVEKMLARCHFLTSFGGEIVVDLGIFFFFLDVFPVMST